MNKWENNRAWLLTVPGSDYCGFQLHYSAHDRGQLFGAGYLRTRTEPVCRYGDVQSRCCVTTRLHEALWRQFLFSGLVLIDRNAAGSSHGPGDAEKRLGRFSCPCGHGPAAFDSLEHHRNDLDDLYPPGYRFIRRHRSTMCWVSPSIIRQARSMPGSP